MNKLSAVMIGSVPMSLHELQLAPAIIGAQVQNRGHNFKYLDINLELYKHCKQDRDLYNECSEILQSTNEPVNQTIEQWLEWISDSLRTADWLLVNVFSVLSHGAALRIISLARKKHSNLKILVGGIGSHRRSIGSEQLFGKYLLDSALVDQWQETASADLIDQVFPLRPSTQQSQVVDFSQHDINNYEWHKDKKQVPFVTSYGCVRRCAFCDVIASFPKYEYVDAKVISDQIVDTYRSTGISTVSFMDSLVNGSMSNFVKLLESLTVARNTGLLPEDFKWSGTYIIRKSSDLLKKIHSLLGPSGVDTLSIGVETGSDAIRYSMDKKFTNKDLLFELEQFSKHGVKCNLLFFPAWPTETHDDFNETLELFEQLAPYAYSGTVDSISFGTSGFVLLDGTPIYENRKEIGLEPGPESYLWKCSLNPELTYWESIRRRLTMSVKSQMLGIPLSLEADFLRHLDYRLKSTVDAILDFHGPCTINPIPQRLDFWDQKHTVKITLVNFGKHDVQVKFAVLDQEFDINLKNGMFEYEFSVEVPVEECDIKLEFLFNSRYTPELKQYNGVGDYHSTNGVYVEQFCIDTRDITLSGFNQTFDETVDYTLPADYKSYKNERCIIADTKLCATKPELCTVHELVSRSIEPATYQEIDVLYNRIKRRLENLYIGNAE